MQRKDDECRILKESTIKQIVSKIFQKLKKKNRKIWLGGAAPQTPRFLAGGAKAFQTPPPLNGRPQHLIEAAKRGRLDQMIFFLGAADNTGPPTTRANIAFGTLFSRYSL